MYKIAINRPIATLMYVMVLTIFGLLSFRSMSVALFPNVDFPIVSIRTIYSGAEASSIESEVTQKIEEAVSGISGVDTIFSNSADGISVVTVKFFLERDINEAANDVRDKVLATSLPLGAKTPLVSKLDIGSAPVVNLFLSAKKGGLQDLMLFADEQAKPMLERLNDVGAVNIIGYRDREIKIFADIGRLNRYGVTISELNDIVKAENIKLGGAKFITNESELIIKVKADALTLDELREIRIKDGVRLADVASVEDSLSDANSYSSYDGLEGVMLEVQKISGSNTLSIVDDVKKTLPRLQQLAGEKFGVEVLNDTSVFIRQSLNDVEFDLIYGSILASIIVFVFLRNFTITVVSALSIPASIIGTFAMMDYMGYDLNKMTLIGLTLAIGIIIDDAIVVVENIYKKIESGMPRYEAAFEGTKEVSFTILAISAMLLAVFIPVSFMDGIVGKFFESFAMTVGFAIIISYTIALTFIPSLSARVLSVKRGSFYDLSEPFFAKLDLAYRRSIELILRHKFKFLLFFLLLVVLSFRLFGVVGMDFMPKEDKGEFEVKLKAESGISLEHMVSRSKKIEDLIRSQSVVEYTTLSVAYNTARDKHKAVIYVKLVPKNQRDLKQEMIVEELRQKLKADSNGMQITASAIPNIRGAGATVPFQMILKSNSFEDLSVAKDAMLDHLAKKEGFVDLDTDLDDAKPQIEVKIKRQNSAKYGISASRIAEAIATAFSSDQEISYFEDRSKQYHITLRFDDANRVGIEDLKKIQLRSSSGELVYLDGLVEFSSSLTQATINRFDREREVMILSDLYDLDLGSALAYVKDEIETILPSSVSYRFSGFAEEMQKTAAAFGFAIALSMVLMYIILAILYESLIQPIIIMVSLPLSVLGVVVALYMAGLQFSLFVMIGFMLLMGMVGKNAVLLVDFANHYVSSGKSVDEALAEAGGRRLRPILMTTIAMIFAMLPLAISGGMGSETKAPMAISVIGGLTSSMFLTLFVVPIIYKLMFPLDLWLRSFYERKNDA